ncbi:MAG: Hsp70 family protein [Betaproteobacteria bacterium]|nr:Hsp70 family protein [Betaproteobacteria bacterium]
MKIGIDFGTTTSNVSVLLPATETIQTIGPAPSLGAWKNGIFMFGDDAIALLNTGDHSVYPIRNLKLSLGTRDIRAGPITIDTEEAVARLLQYLVARTKSLEDVEEAVIGTPVRASHEHRQALLRAAKVAGFRKTRLVYEPTSALVGAVDIRQLDPRSRVLVIDWGGGTLDFSVVRKEGQLLREIDVDGDAAVLGGSQLDRALSELVLDRDPGLRRQVGAIEGGIDRFRHEIERVKIQILEDAESYPEDEPVQFVPAWLSVVVDLYPRDVFAQLGSMAASARDQIVQFLAKCDTPASEISHILFAGGVSRSPIVQDVIAEVFPVAQRIVTGNPQLLTGRGSAELLRRGFSLELAMPFGVRQSDDSFCTMLPSGHPLGDGAFRSADFMVVDVRADEAIFDLGIARLGPTGAGAYVLQSRQRLYKHEDCSRARKGGTAGKHGQSDGSGASVLRCGWLFGS